MHHELTIY